MKSFFGDRKTRQKDINPKDIYFLMEISEDGIFDYVCSLEEDFGISMKEEIQKRSKV